MGQSRDENQLEKLDSFLGNFFLHLVRTLFFLEETHKNQKNFLRLRVKRFDNGLVRKIFCGQRDTNMVLSGSILDGVQPKTHPRILQETFGKSTLYWWGMFVRWNPANFVFGCGDE